ncbi:copper chaperone CopZ [Mycolicibacterium sp. BK634]|uniref:heavy-metal-associated domain-containing protein n=1 Tax=Mycolicibacterium sp. BK634 TaxID=2587099 RepID=UPI001615F5DB|nr:heavy metal-associated domain-containing protein [Mycolicibacterium sp. BK634]MBB3748621.1 copper chaperone CopZ [Mycolicibacterium sp. BK634]
MSVAIRVVGMSCDHCANTIRRAVSALTGVNRVDVDVAGGIVTVDGDCDASAVADAGYTALGTIGPRPPLPIAGSSDNDCCCG